MKITISKGQWEQMGKKAIKTAGLEKEFYSIVLKHYGGQYKPEVIKEDGTMIYNGEYNDNPHVALDKALARIQSYQTGDEI